MEATTSSSPHTAFPPGALHQHLSDQARRQLDALRSAINVRLSVLEAVLADPSRGESLEGLIHDLARVATEEAQAAAAKACFDAKSDAEAAVSGQSTEALLSLEEERGITSQLRDELDVASQRIAALEHQQHTSIGSTREEVDRVVARERATIAELEQAVDEVSRQLEAERAAIADLRRAAAKAEETAHALARETARAQAAERDLAGERAVARDAAAAQQKLQAALDAERAAGAKALQAQYEIKAELARVRETAAGHKEAHARLQAEIDQLAAEATRSRDAGAAQQKALAQAHAELDTERATSARLKTSQQELAADAARAREAVAAQQKALTETKEELTTERATSARLQTAQQELSAEVGRARDAAAVHRKTLTEIESQLEVERAANAKLRAVQERADDLLRTIGSDHTRAQAVHEQLTADLTRERGAAAAAQGALAQARAQLDAERVVTAELRSVVDQAEQRLASVVSENVQTVSVHEDLERKLAAARAETKQLQAELAARTAGKKPPADLPAPAKVEAAKAGSTATHRPAKVIEAEEDAWRPVRLAHRYQFREPIDMQVNGQPGTLFDISITGCQLVSVGAVKPNQTVKLLISAGGGSLACAGKVMWSRLEPPAAGRPFGYRAGVQFAKPDEAANEAFVARRAAAQA